MRFPYAFTVAVIIAGIVRAQDPSARDWIQAHYPDLRVASMQSVLTEAIHSGFVVTPEQKVALKTAYQQLLAKGRSATPTWKTPVQGQVKGSRPFLATDNAFEHESNDGWQYADEMTGQVATGSVLAANDVDSWRFVAPTSAFYTFEVQPTGVNPIADSWLTLRNHKGDPIANDDNGNGLLSRINIYLPAGTYYLDVTGYNGTGGGEYNLVAQSDAVNLVPLGVAGATGTTQIPVGGFAHNVFTFTVPEGRVNMAVTSPGNDTAMVVQRADGMVYFSNDDSSVGGIDAAADIDLPAGTYSAYVWDITGGAGVPFTLSFAATPGALPDLVAAIQTISSVAGDESLRLGHVHLASPARIDVMTEDGPSTPVGDTIMTLFDRDLDYVCDVDDDDSFSPTRGAYSRIAMNLPAGEYFIGVNGYIGLAGDFTVTAVSSAQLPNGVATFGDTFTTIPGFGEIATYTLSNLTPASLQVRASDFWFGILGPDGELASNTRCASWQPQGGELPAGDCTVFVWDRFNYTGPLTCTILPPLYIDATNTLLSRGKEADSVFLFANFTGFSAPFSFADVRGNFCLPFDSLLMTVGDRFAQADGMASWGTIPVGLTGVQLQSGDLHNGFFAPIPAIGTWRNGVEF